MDIESDYPEKPEQAFVEAWIKGSEIHDQQIVLTAHIQEEKTSANDDGSGCGNLLEMGRALARLVKDGLLPRPRRDIRFWWVNELDSQPRYFRENPKEPRRMLVNINQDMVGARQSWGGRVQFASRLPWSLPHASRGRDGERAPRRPRRELRRAGHPRARSIRSRSRRRSRP